MIKNAFGFFLLASISLTGCVNLKPVKTPDTSTYIIDAVVSPVKATATPYSLLVTIPKASPGLTDNHIAYIQQPYELKYFSRNRWVDTPANMLLPLMVQTIQNSGRFQAVVSTPYSGETDLRLDTDILTLQQEFIKTPSLLRLTVRAQLININTHRVVATQVFNIVQPADADSPYGGVKAANKAAANFLNQLSQFCVINTQNIAVQEVEPVSDKHAKKK